MSYELRTGAELFARRPDQVATFIPTCSVSAKLNRDDDHILLESPGFQLVYIGSRATRDHDYRACESTCPPGNGGIQTRLLR